MASAFRFRRARAHSPLHFVAEFEAAALGGNIPGVPFKVKPMKATNASKSLSRKWKQRLALSSESGGADNGTCAVKDAAPGIVDRMGPPFWMRNSSSLPSSNSWLATEARSAPSSTGLDGRLVMKHRRQERARADQVARRDEDRVLVALAQAFFTTLPWSPTRRRHLYSAGAQTLLNRPPIAHADCMCLIRVRTQGRPSGPASRPTGGIQIA